VALAGAGLTIGDRQPSFLLDDALPVTGEVDRSTALQTGMPPEHQRRSGGGWEPDRLVHEDQAVVLHPLPGGEPARRLACSATQGSCG
jgi:7,8-dihydropterin-6-yl-methyl-4-(beta-D-ribofuranosyl)aminobenzene 5'-phosphate synthase